MREAIFTPNYIYFEAIGQLYRVNRDTDQVYYKEYGKWYPMEEGI